MLDDSTAVVADLHTNVVYKLDQDEKVLTVLSPRLF